MKIIGKQDEEIKTWIYLYLRSGIIDKGELYTAVVNQLKVPRPTVRRVACVVRKELEIYTSILNAPAKRK